MEHTHGKENLYGFPTIFGRGLLDEFKNFVNPPFLWLQWRIYGQCLDIILREWSAKLTFADRSSR